MPGRERWSGTGRTARLALSAVALTGALVSCERADLPTSVTNRAQRPLMEEQASDCSSTSQRCEAIRGGIEYLRNHWAEECRQAAVAAQATLDAPAGVGGFRDAPPNDNAFGMSVPMHTVPAGATLSGWARNTDYIDIGRNFDAAIGQSSAIGGLIAHEYEHYNGNEDIYHTQGNARRAQSTCENPNNS